MVKTAARVQASFGARLALIIVQDVSMEAVTRLMAVAHAMLFGLVSCAIFRRVSNKTRAPGEERVWTSINVNALRASAGETVPRAPANSGDRIAFISAWNAPMGTAIRLMAVAFVIPFGQASCVTHHYALCIMTAADMAHASRRTNANAMSPMLTHRVTSIYVQGNVVLR